MSLLKTDVELYGTEFDIDEKELVAAVFGQLRQKKYKLYYPKTIPVGLNPVCISNDLSTCSPLFKALANLADAYADANAADLRDQLGDTTAMTSEKKKKRELLKLLNNIYDAAMKEMGLLKDQPPVASATPEPTPTQTPKPDASAKSDAKPTGNTDKNQEENGKKAKEEEKEKQEEEKPDPPAGDTFIAYLQAEALYNLMKGQKTYWIDMGVVKAGGNTRIKSNFITNFLYGSRVNFSGGAIAYFNVFTFAGESRVSGVVPFYERYLKSSRINDTCN